ncbi:hypothetical protein [Nonomuraea cavernae]|uniref:hypothetical protein n=1 Tax=Nonomuraea cavernae TaxID=2045107 RepID=UPI0033D5B043
MLSLPGLLVLTIAALTAAIACALTLATGVSWPTALLSGGAAGGVALGVVPRLLGGDDD